MCNSAFKQRMDLISLSVFVDVTFRYHVFVHYKLDWSSTDMVQKINNEYFTCKKCPVGCGEFIDNFGTVDFVHFLSRVFPDFKSFCADANSHLRGMRSDYELPDFIFPNDHLDPVVKPLIFVSDDENFLLTTRIMIKKSQNNTRIYQNILVDEFSIHYQTVLHRPF